MKIIRSLSELRAWRNALNPNAKIGFIPTMGALHAGHVSLMRLARERCAVRVVSIFVNPLQFGPKEDFAQYPRPFEKDAALCEEEKIDVLFAPEASEFYASDFSTFVEETQASSPLCGALRPGHFRGVTTVVLKFFNLVQPHFAYFGQKDAQQCAVIERMVRDLNLNLEVIRGETLRESDGLALSSRNAYLSTEERASARRIYESLTLVKAEILRERENLEDRENQVVLKSDSLNTEGNLRWTPGISSATARARDHLGPEFRVQYFEVLDAETLQPIQSVASKKILVAIAAYLGKTRLIDNLEV